MYSTEQIIDISYKDIQTLYRLSFGSIVSISAINMKYDTIGFGLKNIGILAKSENGQPSAFYGVFPISLIYEFNQYLIAQAGDAMTAPDHRKKGLFVKVARETYELSKKKGIKLIYGFPNENSYPGHKSKLNWVFNDFMQKFTINVLTLPICEIASKYKLLEPAYNRFVKKRLGKYMIIPDETVIKSFNYSKVKGHIKKDDNFFEYKMRRENRFIISIDGFTLFIKVKRHLYIGDIGKIEKSQSKELLEVIKKLARRLGCMRSIITLSKNHWLFQYLKREIEPIDGLPIGFYLIDEAIDYREIQFTGADYDTF